jgi:hypothetical protein
MQLVYSTNTQLTDLFHFKQKTLMEATFEDLNTLQRHCKGKPLSVLFHYPLYISVIMCLINIGRNIMLMIK